MTIDKHHVATTLNYWDDPGDGSKPTPIFIGKGRISNKRPHKAHDFVVSDVSGEEDRYTLDGQGFQYLQHKSREELFTDEQQIRTTYYPECEQLVKAITGARQVHIFNHKVRRGPTQWHHLGLHNLANRGPVTRTHVDQSYEGAERRLRWELPDEADDVIKKRYQIINVWRPIRGPVQTAPLLICAWDDLADDDLIVAERHYPDGRVGSIYQVAYNPSQRWLWFPQMERDEIVLLKCYDSLTDGTARWTAHGAFWPRQTPADAPPRESIEIRSLIFFD